MERDSGEAKQSNSDQKKYSNFKTFIGFNFMSMSINRSILNQSNTIQISIDFVSEVYTFVEDNVRGETTHLNGETIRPTRVNNPT